MGKFHSKHVCRREGPEGECFLVNAQLHAVSGTEESSSITEECGEMLAKPTSHFLQDSVPLRVVLPPLKSGSSPTAKIFSLDTNKMAGALEDTTDNNVTDNSLHVEEYECGVSVAGSDKQEWAFTLYDFDGKGKITKEDLAQLLRSLYDAVGSSISLPQTGAKSLKLKLTVSPDQTKQIGQQNAVQDSKSPRNGHVNGHSHAPTNGIGHLQTNGLSRAQTNGHSKRRSKHVKDSSNNHHHHRHSNNPNHNKTLSNPIDPTTQVADKDCGKSPENPLLTTDSNGNPQQNNLSAPSHQNGVTTTTRIQGTGEGGVLGEADLQMTTSEKQQLVRLVARNMEKHQQRLQRKIRRRATEPASTSRAQHHVTTSQENPDRRNYYKDLAGIDHAPQDPPSPDPETQKLLNTSAPLILDQQQSSMTTAAVSNHYRKKYKHLRARKVDKSRSFNLERTPTEQQPLGLVKINVNVEGQDAASPNNVGIDSLALNDELTMLDNYVNKEIERTAENMVLMRNSPANKVTTTSTTSLNNVTVDPLAAAGTLNSPRAANVNLAPVATAAAAAAEAPPKVSKHHRSKNTTGGSGSPRDYTKASGNVKDTVGGTIRNNGVIVGAGAPAVDVESPVGSAVSPHHQRRHRHRHQQHRRAMQQVAAWIEHSVSPPTPALDPGATTANGVVNAGVVTSPVTAINTHTEHVANGIVNNMAASTLPVPTSGNMNTSRVVGTKMVGMENGKSLVRPVFGSAVSGEQALVQRHEHHHIHEHHHHHHYHHYHET